MHQTAHERWNERRMCEQGGQGRGRISKLSILISHHNTHTSGLIGKLHPNGRHAPRGALCQQQPPFCFWTCACSLEPSDDPTPASRSNIAPCPRSTHQQQNVHRPRQPPRPHTRAAHARAVCSDQHPTHGLCGSPHQPCSPLCRSQADRQTHPRSRPASCHAAPPHTSPCTTRLGTRSCPRVPVPCNTAPASTPHTSEVSQPRQGSAHSKHRHAPCSSIHAQERASYWHLATETIVSSTSWAAVVSERG